MITIKAKAGFQRGRKGAKVLKVGEAEVAPRRGRVPRVARLLALAHRFEKMIADGVVRDYAELARLGHVSRARVSQIMDLLLLTPDIQEVVLFWPASFGGHDSIHERHLRPIVAVPDWEKQRRMWRRLALSE